MNSKSIIVLLAASFVLQAKDMGRVARELEQNRSGIGRYIAVNKVFSRPNDGITNLKGLDQIPNIEQAWVVNLQGNDLGVIKSGTFKDTKFKNIKWLNLSHCNIREIEQGGLDGLENLQVLFLGHNQLKMFKPGTFKGLKKLRVLTLNGNPDDATLKSQARKQLP